MHLCFLCVTSFLLVKALLRYNSSICVNFKCLLLGLIRGTVGEEKFSSTPQASSG